MCLNHKSSAANVLIFHVVLVLLSNAMLHAEGQYLPMACLIDCGLKLVSCAGECGTNPVCLIGCGTSEIVCVASCNASSVEIPTVVPGVEVAGSGEAGIQRGTVKAVAIISSSSFSGDDNLRGSLQFLQDSSIGVTHIEGRIAGLIPGLHGLHIRAADDTTNGCSSTRPHFNPINKDHGALSDQNHHAGNLGKILADPDGIAEISIKEKHIPLSGPHSILGQAVVVRADADDFGRGGNEFSKISRNAGGRIGCGIIRPQSAV